MCLPGAVNTAEVEKVGAELRALKEKLKQEAQGKWDALQAQFLTQSLCLLGFGISIFNDKNQRGNVRAVVLEGYVAEDSAYWLWGFANGGPWPPTTMLIRADLNQYTISSFGGVTELRGLAPFFW